MILKRAAYESLLEWKASLGPAAPSLGAAGGAPPRRALLLDGARQVGKTHLIEQFGKTEYDHFVKVDFLADERAADLLGSARDVHQVTERLSLLAGRPLAEGDTLVFFDEVQEAPNLFTFSKYLADDGRFDLAMSGSMLGVELASARSFPVGYLHELRLWPLTFEEFCWSAGVPEGALSEVGECCREARPVDDAVHERLIDLFRIYVVVGGMPAAVSAYHDSLFDLSAVRGTLSDLTALYRDDIAKYAGGRALQVKSIFDAMPSQLAKENKRFELKSLRSQARFERFANDFAWLVAAGAALKVNSVTEPRVPLARTQEEARFKLFPSDVGMLMSMYPPAVSQAAVAADRDVNFGAVYECAVAQELSAAGLELRYWRSSQKGEVDFLVEGPDGSVLPIEVKSGKAYKRHMALNNLLGEDAYGISEAVVLSEANVSCAERVGKRLRYLPLYMAAHLASLQSPQPSVLPAPPAWE